MVVLPPKPDFDVRLVDSQHGCCQVPYREVTLGTPPDGYLALRRPPCGCRVRLDVTLMNRVGAVHFFHHQIGFCETLFKVSEFELSMTGDVSRYVVVKLRSAFCHCAFDIGNGGQNLVFNLDQAHSFLGSVHSVGSNRGDGVTFVKHLASCQTVAGAVKHILGDTAGRQQDRFVFVKHEVR